jgi:hypothetical protein
MSDDRSPGVAAGAEFLAAFADAHGQRQIKAAVDPDAVDGEWIPAEGERIRIDLGDGSKPVWRTIEQAIEQEDGSYAITFTTD